MDDRERDKFYSAPGDATEDDEYQLEPLDEGVLRTEDRQAKQTLESAKVRIDIDDIYGEAEREHGSEILQRWIRDFHFRFQLKHLLMATAVLAIALTLSTFGLFWHALILLLMLSIGGLFFYLKWQERKQQELSARKREELYARRRAQFGEERAAPPATTPAVPKATPPTTAPLPSDDVEWEWQEARTRQPFRFHFSLLELIMAMTTAAAVLGLMRVLGGPSATATVLGVVALLGLVIHAVGYDPPQIVILGWWFTLVLYVLLSVFAVVWRGFA